MAKSKKRSETASPSQSGAVKNPGANGSASDAGETRDRIALRAYELYLARGGADGGDFDDWITAERELTRSKPQPGSGRGE